MSQTCFRVWDITFIQKIKKTRREVEKVLKKTNKIMKWRTDKSRGEAIEYKEGNLV